MARPIEPTPVLKDEDAKRLLAQVKNPDRTPEKRAFMRQCDSTYRKYQAHTK
jgi:hypothetical protein